MFIIQLLPPIILSQHKTDKTKYNYYFLLGQIMTHLRHPYTCSLIGRREDVAWWRSRYVFIKMKPLLSQFCHHCHNEFTEDSLMKIPFNFIAKVEYAIKLASKGSWYIHALGLAQRTEIHFNTTFNERKFTVGRRESGTKVQSSVRFTELNREKIARGTLSDSATWLVIALRGGHLLSTYQLD